MITAVKRTDPTDFLYIQYTELIFWHPAPLLHAQRAPTTEFVRNFAYPLFFSIDFFYVCSLPVLGQPWGKSVTASTPVASCLDYSGKSEGHKRETELIKYLTDYNLYSIIKVLVI